MFGPWLPLRPATPGWGAGVCVCALRCTPPLLAGVCCVGVWVWARVLAARRLCWLGCWGVCAFVCALCLYPATPGWSVRCGCVCLGSGFGCAPPLLAGPFWCVCVWLCALLVPCDSWLGFVLCGLGVAWHLFLCRGWFRDVRVARICGTHGPLLLGTCPCALVVAGGVPLWCALWPRVGARTSSGPVALGALVGFSDAVLSFCIPGGLHSRIYWAAARGSWRPAKNRALCACRWPLPRQGLWACSVSYPFGVLPWGCPWRVPPWSVLGCVRCGGLRVWTRSVTRPVSCAARLSTGDSASAPGLFRVDADTAPFGSRTPRRCPVRVCVCVCVSLLPGFDGLASGPRSSAPYLFLWPVLVRSLFVLPPWGWDYPVCGCCWVFFFFSLLHPPRLRRCLLSLALAFRQNEK